MRNISKLIFIFSNFINKILKVKIISNQKKNLNTNIESSDYFKTEKLILGLLSKKIFFRKFHLREQFGYKNCSY